MQKAEQMASAISQALSLRVGGVRASNITRMSLNVGQAVNNSISQVIESVSKITQIIEVKGCAELVDISFVNMRAFQATTIDQLQKVEQVASAITALKQEAKQIAKAKEEPLFGGLGVILLLVVVIVLSMGMKFLIPALIVGGILFAVYYFVVLPKRAEKDEEEFAR
jgi:phage-related minor tail protein